MILPCILVTRQQHILSINRCLSCKLLRWHIVTCIYHFPMRTDSMWITTADGSHLSKTMSKQVTECDTPSCRMLQGTVLGPCYSFVGSSRVGFLGLFIPRVGLLKAVCYF
jgi:hypothetical protein